MATPWLLLDGLMRRKGRTLLALGTLVVTFALFVFLLAFGRMLSLGVDVVAADKLVVMHRTSPIEVLPLSMVRELAQTEGVRAVSHRTWFGGYYRETGNQRPMWAVDPAAFLALHPELVFPDAEGRTRFLAGGDQMAVGRPVAEAFGWKVGDRVPLTSYIWGNQNRGNTWLFTVAAIFEGADASADTGQVLIPYAAFDGARTFGRASVGFIELALHDANRAAEVAARIDAAYLNSPAPTRTSTLRGYLEAFASQIGRIGSLISALLSLVVLTTLLLVANGFIHSLLERRADFALLKTLGFSNARLALQVLAEALLLVGVGGLLGVALGSLLVHSGGAALATVLPGLQLRAADLALALAVMLALAALAAAWPMRQVVRLRITAGLRGEV